MEFEASSSRSHGIGPYLLEQGYAFHHSELLCSKKLALVCYWVLVKTKHLTIVY